MNLKIKKTVAFLIAFLLILTGISNTTWGISKRETANKHIQTQTKVKKPGVIFSVETPDEVVTTPKTETKKTENSIENKTGEIQNKSQEKKAKNKNEKEKTRSKTKAPKIEFIEQAVAQKNEKQISHDLNFTFSSEKNPWSEKELETLKKQLADFYPLAKKVFGSPAASIDVNIRKNPESGPMFWQSGEVSEIILPEKYASHQLLHEMLHSFHSPYIMHNNAFEEGMVRAAEVEIMNRLPKYEYENRNHSYSVDIYYEANNESTVSAFNGKFFSGFINAFLRYQQAGYAWGKCLIEDENFLVKFNESYYEKARQDSDIAKNSDELKKIVREILSKVEGQDFEKWFSSQAVFDFSPESGYQMFLKRDSQNFYIFHRDEDGKEKMIPDASFTWKIYDYAGEELGDGKGKTNSNGWNWLNLSVPASKATRVRIAVEANLPNGQVLKKEFVSHVGLAEKGIFGIVENYDSGKIRVSGKNFKTEVPVVNGTFSVPKLEETAGTFKLEYVRDGKNLEKTITKDASGYYVTLEE
jgi:hypothetical protein